MRKWKPSKSQRVAFAEKMKDPAEKAAYIQRAEDKAEKRRAGSKFDYHTAGGEFVPTEHQGNKAMEFLRTLYLSAEDQSALNQVLFAAMHKEKTHHDNIHILNELIRANG